MSAEKKDIDIRALDDFLARVRTVDPDNNVVSASKFFLQFGAESLDSLLCSLSGVEDDLRFDHASG